MNNLSSKFCEYDTAGRIPADSALMRYLHFLLFKEIEPRWDDGMVEAMSSFYRRYSWALQVRDDSDTPIEAFLQQEMKSSGISGKPDDIEFYMVHHWYKLDGYGGYDDTNPFVPFVEESIAGITIHICLRNAFIPDELIFSDHPAVCIAAVRESGQRFNGMLVIPEELDEALGDENDHMRYVIATEYYRAPVELRELIHDADTRYEIARLLAYLASCSHPHASISEAELIAAFHTANPGKPSTKPAAVSKLLELLCFISRDATDEFRLTQSFDDCRLLLSAFGVCMECTSWQIDEEKDSFGIIAEHFPRKVAQEYLPLLIRPEIAERLLEPVLLIAEHHTETLSQDERKALFDYMMDSDPSENCSFILRIADALLADSLTPYEANCFIETVTDEIPEPVLNHIRTQFRSSTNNPKFYYVFALRTICEDEPACAVSLGQELALDTRPDLKVLGYAVLGTLAKAVLDRWDLPDVMPECITSEALANDLFSLAAANHSAQGFYQKMLANLVCAGFLKVTAGTVPAIQTLPRQYRDLWLSEGILSSIGFYPREFYCLDNFAPFQIQYEGTLYPTVEHAYQAQKFILTAPEIAEQIRTAASPHDAKKIASANREYCPPDWDERKLLLMEDLLRAKLEQHPYVRQKLLETGSIPIVEDSPKDTFWGCGYDRSGKNHLGKIWMKLRAELNAETPLQE